MYSLQLRAENSSVKYFFIKFRQNFERRKIFIVKYNNKWKNHPSNIFHRKSLLSNVVVISYREKNVGGKWRKFLRVWRNFSPTKNFPDILSPDQNFHPIYLSLTETFTQNFILQPNKPKVLHPESQNLVLYITRRITRFFFELVKETNSFGQFSHSEVTKL